jgi:large subunit ribosomal protein L4
MPSVKVLDAKGKETGSMDLSPDVFGVEIRTPLLHQAVVRELADRRAGTHDTKGRSEVSGGGKKPWKQKGTGRARQGSIRAPQWKGGGKPFGPTPRSYDKAMPREMRREALRAAVAAKIADGALRVVDSVTSDGKTKSLVAWLAALGMDEAPTLLVAASRSEPLVRAARNVRWLTVETPTHVSVYQLLRAAHVAFERAGLDALQRHLAYAQEGQK